MNRPAAWSRVQLGEKLARAADVVARAADVVEDSRLRLLARVKTVPAVRRKAVLHGALVGGYVGFALLVMRGTDSPAWDAFAYWSVNLADPYAGAYGTSGFFPYSPPAALLAVPFAWLPWPIFAMGWGALLLAVLGWLGGRAFILLLAFPPIAGDIYTGNINLLLAAAMVVGFRYPAAWAFVLLTKVTPGVGLLWFAVRREWRSLAIALVTTLVVVLVSWLFLADQWLAWLAALQRNAGTVPELVPLWVRLPLAALIVAWGAAKDAPWVVPIGAALAAPALFMVNLAVLAACWPLRHGLPGAAVAEQRPQR